MTVSSIPPIVTHECVFNDFTGAFNPDDMFYENHNEPNAYQSEGLESESDSSTSRRKAKPTQYAYDAAAERTQARITRGRVSTIAHTSTIISAVQ